MRAFRPNPSFERDLRAQPEFKQCMRAAAESIVSAARAAAPDVTGAYRDSLQVVEDGDTIAAATTDRAGHLVEFGSVNNPAYAPLRRGTRAAGLRLEEAPPQ